MTRHFNINAIKASVLAFVLACLGICAAAPSAYAIITPNLDAECSLTVNLKTTDGDVAPGITLGIIRVASPEVGNTGYYYQLTDDFASSGVVLENIGTASADLAMASALADYASEKGYAYTTAVTDDAGVASFTGLKTGLYVVNMVAAPKGYTLASPFLVTMPQGNFDDGWVYDVTADAKPIELSYVEPTPEPVIVDPPVKKTVTGDTPSTKGTFKFTMTRDDSSYPMPAGSTGDSKTITVKGPGSYEFGENEMTEAGTYTYTFKEEKLSEAGYTYDGSTYKVAHQVTESDGKLVAKTTITKDGSPVDEIAFENKYTATPQPTPESVLVDPPVKKTVTGDTPSTKGTFKFTMTRDKSSYPMPDGSSGDSKTIEVKGPGSYEFGATELTEVGTYTYTFKEEKLSEKGYTYDGSTYKVTHVVTLDEKNNKLVAKTTITKDGSKVNAIEFENKYSKSGGGTTPSHRLPQTGQIWLPVYVLAIVGMLLFVAGWARSRRSQRR